MVKSVTSRPFSPIGDPGLDNDPTLHLTRVFVYFLQNLFRDFPEGCGMTWRPEEENTELIISAEKPRSDAIEKLPHITCVLGASRWTGVGIDQMQFVQSSDGQRTHTDLMPATITYHCQAKEGIVARRIAWNASLYTNVLRRFIMRVGGIFQVGTNHDISAESSASMFTGPKSSDELVAVTVQVPFYWQPQWRIRRASELWRNMKLTFHINQATRMYSAGRANALKPPRVKGVPVNTQPLDPPSESFVQEVRESNYAGEE
ncbi:MAG: hypothetical protein HKO76_07575 [Acidimicrobiia bacterium]|nr:hypothetical protein [Acidimicrobiia bacterium]